MSHFDIYGSELSYFTRKAQAALEWYHPDVTYTPKSFDNREEIEQRAGTHQVPVVRTPAGWFLSDSTPILHHLDGTLFAGGALLYPGSPFTQCVVALLEDYYDEWIPRLAVHSRWNFPESAEVAVKILAQDQGLSLEDPNFSNLCTMISNWGGRACRATGISTESQKQHGSEELLRVSSFFDDHLAAGNKFVLGDLPCALDAVIYGGLAAHFLADEWPTRLLESNLKHLPKWKSEAGRARFYGASFDAKNNLDPDNLPLFITRMLGEFQSTYREVVFQNTLAIAENKKSFKARVYGEEVSFLAKPYVEKSREMLRQFFGTCLAAAPEDKEAFVRLLRKYGLESLYYPNDVPCARI